MNHAPAATNEEPTLPQIDTVMQGWEKFAADITDPKQEPLNALLRFTYFQGGIDMMHRIKKINENAKMHRDMARTNAELNALVRELNDFFAGEATIPTELPEPAPDRPRLILPH